VVKRLFVVAMLALAAFFGGSALHEAKAQAACTSWNVNAPYASGGYGVFDGSASCSGYWTIFLYAQKLYQGGWQNVGSTYHFGSGIQYARVDIPGYACGVWYRTYLQGPYLDVAGPATHLC
jgi:hypothetical protein